MPQIKYKNHLFKLAPEEMEALKNWSEQCGGTSKGIAFKNLMEGGEYLSNWWEGVCDSDKPVRDAMEEMRDDPLYNLQWRSKVDLGICTEAIISEWETDLKDTAKEVRKERRKAIRKAHKPKREKMKRKLAEIVALHLEFINRYGRHP